MDPCHWLPHTGMLTWKPSQGTKLYCLVNTGTLVWTSCPRSLPDNATAGVEPMTSRSRVQHASHYTTKPVSRASSLSLKLNKRSKWTRGSVNKYKVVGIIVYTYDVCVTAAWRRSTAAGSIGHSESDWWRELVPTAAWQSMWLSLLVTHGGWGDDTSGVCTTISCTKQGSLHSYSGGFSILNSPLSYIVPSCSVFLASILRVMYKYCEPNVIFLARVVVVVVVIARRLFSFRQLSRLRKSAIVAGSSHKSCSH